MEKLLVGEVEQGSPVRHAMLMSARSETDADSLVCAQKGVHLSGSSPGLLRTLRIGPEVFQSLRGEQGAGCNQRFEGVLIEGQAVHLADKISEMGLEPEGKALEDGGDVLALVSLVSEAACAAAAGVIGGSQGDARVRSACQQRGLSSARVPGDHDMAAIHKGLLPQVVRHPMV